MTERLKFEPIPGVTLYPSTNPLTLLLSADSKKLKEIKKLLTVRNKSAAWQVMSAKKKMEYWLLFDQSKLDADNIEKVQRKINDCQKIIDEYEPQIIQHFFTDHDSHLEVPAGFWWLGSATSHENTLLQPYFLPGLRDYQIECLTEMYRYNRATGVLATGLGKSKIIASLCVSTVNSGRRACVVVPTEYLVGQVYDTISEVLPNVKAVGGKRKALPLGADVLVTTAASAAKWITDYHTIIIDESHHSPASTWVNLLTSAEKTTHVYNLTATPMRADGLDLAIHAFGGPVVYERDTRWGIANGWLKPCKVYMAFIDCKRADGSVLFLPDKMPANTAYGILTKNDEVLQYVKKMLLKAVDQGRSVMVLFKTVASCEALAKVLAKEVKVEVATGDYKKPLQDFRDGHTKVIISNDRLVSEGIDLPELDCLITIVQNASDITTYQSVGRILRKPPGNTKTAIVIDITTNGYAQYTRSQNSRAAVYNAITDDVSLLSK